jgi:hypothetical protein
MRGLRFADGVLEMPTVPEHISDGLPTMPHYISDAVTAPGDSSDDDTMVMVDDEGIEELGSEAKDMPVVGDDRPLKLNYVPQPQGIVRADTRTVQDKPNTIPRGLPLFPKLFGCRFRRFSWD